ncbi:uncharacterized protein NFIA_109240 [Aspergillus fischeri NRRL 181]|uniref:Uncharacterized protein n=1 Tax=Neosartorya fischeri (strain ATCC 1020 / DSM 3700 / CBS 544.65 / FGSC A1164 / JCM 1740 / NRRL 181 / WB 181) TaxID=331117 RepID=A1CXS8_NEOFI|nr:uncharacterized protein NFIA_109240 [Aspergillus fischeri NRRL 181]EAW25430.1 hypothetical protein NFIA_109240 [Aspergillus fischeri NRRL 181]
MDSSTRLFLDELEDMKDDFRMEETRDSQIHHELDQLLRKGLQPLIVEAHQQSDTGTQSSGDRALQPLSRIVPSVFSLGYRHEPAIPLDSVHREVPSFNAEDDDEPDFAEQNQQPSSFA